MNSRIGLILCILCSVSSATYSMFEGPGSCCEEGIINPGFGIVKNQTYYPAYPASYQNVVNTAAFTHIQKSKKTRQKKEIIIPAAYQHLFGQNPFNQDSSKPKKARDILHESVPFEIFFKFQEKSEEESEK